MSQIADRARIESLISEQFKVVEKAKKKERNCRLQWHEATAENIRAEIKLEVIARLRNNLPKGKKVKKK